MYTTLYVRFRPHDHVENVAPKKATKTHRWNPAIPTLSSGTSSAFSPPQGVPNLKNQGPADTAVEHPHRTSPSHARPLPPGRQFPVPDPISRVQPPPG